MQRISGRANGGWIVIVLVIAALAAAVVAFLYLDTTGQTGSGLSQAYAYDLGQLARIDPNLILYGESGPAIRTGLSQSRAIALDSTGRIYLAGDRVIRVFDNSGSVERTIQLAGEPQCLTVWDDGSIYVGMKDHVEVLDPEGKPVASWESLGDEAVLTSIARHGEAVFVADAGHRVVLHYDTAGTLVGHIGEKDPDRNIPGFAVPSPHFDLAVSRDGMLRVVNPGRNRIDTFTVDGDLEFWWGERSNGIKGFCGCCNPVSFALLPDGGFVTAEKGLVRVKVYNSDGGFVGVVAGPDQFAGGKQIKICETPEECQGAVLDVAAGADGRIYVLDPADNTIKVFAKRILDRSSSMTHTGGSAPRPPRFSALSQQHGMGEEPRMLLWAMIGSFRRANVLARHPDRASSHGVPVVRHLLKKAGGDARPARSGVTVAVFRLDLVGAWGLLDPERKNRCGKSLVLSCYWPKATNLGGSGAEPLRSMIGRSGYENQQTNQRCLNFLGCDSATCHKQVAGTDASRYADLVRGCHGYACPAMANHICAKEIAS
jgi:hypothetical protein